MLIELKGLRGFALPGIEFGFARCWPALSKLCFSGLGGNFLRQLVSFSPPGPGDSPESGTAPAAAQSRSESRAGGRSVGAGCRHLVQETSCSREWRLRPSLPDPVRPRYRGRRRPANRSSAMACFQLWTGLVAMSQLIGQNAVVDQQIHIPGSVAQRLAGQGVGFVKAILLGQIVEQRIARSGVARDSPAAPDSTTDRFLRNFPL